MSHDLYTLRFEDLAAAPFQYTRKLYNFLGMNLHPNVTQFITKATNYTGSDLDRPFFNAKEQYKSVGETAPRDALEDGTAGTGSLFCRHGDVTLQSRSE